MSLTEKEATPGARNDFDKIIDDCGIEIKDSDLLKLLDMKTGLHSQMIVLAVPLAIQGAIIFAGFDLVPTSVAWINWLCFGLYACLLIYFAYLVHKLFTSDPSDKQRRLLKEYINARTRLNDLQANAGD